MSKTRNITLMALFSAISIVLTRFAAITIPLGGFPSFSLELGGIPIALGGIILGPFAGGIIGLVSDLVGYLINDRGGVFFLGFTFNSILTGVIPGIICMIFNKEKIRQKIFPTIDYVVIWLLASLGIVYALVVDLSEELLIWKTLGVAMMIVIAIVLTIILAFMNKHRDKKDLCDFDLVVLCVSLVEVFVYICLTPIWIGILYGVPSIISVASRVFRAVIMIPIKSIIIYACIKALRLSLGKVKSNG